MDESFPENLTIIQAPMALYESDIQDAEVERLQAIIDSREDALAEAYKANDRLRARLRDVEDERDALRSDLYHVEDERDVQAHMRQVADEVAREAEAHNLRLRRELEQERAAKIVMAEKIVDLQNRLDDYGTVSRHDFDIVLGERDQARRDAEDYRRAHVNASGRERALRTKIAAALDA